MADINKQIEQSIQAFVTELSGLVRAAAVDAVQAALGGTARSAAPVAARRGPGRPRKTEQPAAKPAKAPKAKAGTRGRRTAAQIASLVGDVLAYIKAHPGMRSEKIRAAMKIGRPAMRDALDRLGEAKKIKMKGVKRAASYTAV